MSLEQITEKIISDARNVADKVLADANSKATKILSDAKNEDNKLKDLFQKRFADEKPKIHKRREIVANLEAKKRMLLSKRTLIQDVYNEALKQMEAFTKEDYLCLCESLLDKSVLSKDEEVLVGKNEKYITEAWINEYNSKKGTTLKISQDDVDIKGGFILKRDRIRTNCSWDMLIQVAQEKKESEVVKRLFPSEE